MHLFAFVFVLFSQELCDSYLVNKPFPAEGNVAVATFIKTNLVSFHVTEEKKS